MSTGTGSVRHGSPYWRRTCAVTVAVVGVWLLLSVGVVQAAVYLAARRMIDWPVAFFVAAQGVPFLFVVLAAIYAWAMRQLERGAQPGEPAE